MAITIVLCLVSSVRINHLGIKPDKGGRPPNERRLRGVSKARRGF